MAIAPFASTQPIQNRVDFIGPVYFGSSGNQTGLVTFYSLSSYLATSFQAGNAAAAVAYVLPTAGPAGNNYLLGSSTSGVLSWINAPGIYAPINNPTFTGQVLIPDGTQANPGLGFSSDTNSGLRRVGADNIALISGGDYAAGGARLTVSNSGFDMSLDGATTLLGLNGNTNNDMALQIANGSSGTSAVSVLSATTGRTALLLAAFGANYVGSRCSQPAADLSAIEFGGTTSSGAAIVTQTNIPMFFGTNQTLAATITTGQVLTLVNAPVFSSLTATTVPYLNASKALTSSSVTPTELGYVSGVTSAIQTQLNAKATDSLAAHLAGSETLTGTKSFTASVPMQIQAGTSDSTLYKNIYFMAGGGGSTVGVECNSQTTISITTAKTIYTLDAGPAMLWIIGSDGAGNQFVDQILAPNSATAPTPVFSGTGKGSPAARTYTMSSVDVQLAMASGTYTTRVLAFDMAIR